MPNTPLYPCSFTGKSGSNPLYFYTILPCFSCVSLSESYVCVNSNSVVTTTAITIMPVAVMLSLCILVLFTITLLFAFAFKMIPVFSI